MERFDFSGWATRNDLLCADGRTIRQNAFKDDDGKTVPVIWNHEHGNPDAVLGHALLKNCDEGVYAYVKLNDTKQGKNMKKVVQHGDVRSLSIYANKLKQIGGDVIHGSIKELSLVLAGANPGATIDFVMAHGDDEGEAMIANYDENAILLYHSDEAPEEPTIEHSETEKEDKSMAEETKKTTASEEGEGKTVKEVWDGITKKLDEDEMDVVYAMIGSAAEGASESSAEHSEFDEGDDDVMKHNVFDQEETITNGVLSHSDQEAIIKMAKGKVGSFQEALSMYAEENALQHDAVSSGFTQDTEVDGNITWLFPEYKDVRPGAPELITNDQGWISVVMSKVHKSPISRLRTQQVDIRNIDALRAKGYQKGKDKKQTGNFKLVRRTTDPQTIYVKSALHRDDIIDITDFDYVSYLYKIDRMQLNEEIATAIMFGDGREDGDEDKIAPDKIRPIWTDDDLYTLHVDIDLAKAKSELQGSGTGVSFGENYILAEALITSCLYARENYKGSGTPDMFIDPHQLNIMLLARDMNGRRIYASKAELTAALNVVNIYTVEQMKDKTRTDSAGKTKKLLCLIANLGDYTLGATKGGEISHFTQFDIDFNQEKSLLETRCSGALTKVYSAIAIEQDVTAAG